MLSGLTHWQFNGIAVCGFVFQWCVEVVEIVQNFTFLLEIQVSSNQSSRQNSTQFYNVGF